MILNLYREIIFNEGDISRGDVYADLGGGWFLGPIEEIQYANKTVQRND